MHKEGLGLALARYAVEVEPHNAIVEVGSWMGASAWHLAEGSGVETEIHLYDRWCANQSEVDKLKKWGVDVEVGADLLPLVQMNLLGFGDRIHYHKGDVRQQRYTGKQDIALYVDDASKNQISNVLPNFRSRFVPGCIVILCDYFFLP